MKCNICDKDAEYLRATQFAGDHYFCKDHAIVEERFGQNDSYQVWYEIVKVFVPNKLSGPIFFKRQLGTNFLRLTIETGFCTFNQLKKEMDEAQNHLSNRLKAAKELVRKHSESESGDMYGHRVMDFNKDKMTENEKLEIDCLIQEGFIQVISIDPSQQQVRFIAPKNA